MASEEASEPVSITVPEELAAWLRRRADERGVDVEQYSRQLLAAQRAVDTGAIEDPEVVSDLVTQHDLEDRVDERLADRLDDLQDGPLGESGDRPDDGVEERLNGRLDEVESEFRELLEDVRSRVIQVKRETDQKAPADHDHDGLDELDALEARVESLAADAEEHADVIEALREDLDGGFENFEEVLEYLVETTDDLSERADRLARATLQTREQVRELATTVGERERVDQFKRDAALEGVTAADCEECGHSVRVSLLTAPRCPACSAGFVDLEPKQGLFGSATFRCGDRPALSRGEGDDVTGEIEDALAEDRPHPGEVYWESAGDRS